MAKFIKFNIVGNASQYENGELLVNVDQIGKVEQSADQTLVLTLVGGTTDIATLTVTASTVAASGASAVNPTYGSGAPLKQAVNKALTANPGGVKASVQAPKDDADAVVYFVDYAWT